MSAKRFVRLVLGLTGAVLIAQLSYLWIVSRPELRSWLKTQLERSGSGVFSLGAIGGFPLRLTLADVAFESRGPSNLKRLRAPKAYVTIDWVSLLLERRIVLKSLVLDGAQLDLRIDGGRPEQVAFPVRVPEVTLRRCNVRVANLSGWTAFLADVHASMSQAGPDVGGPLKSLRATLANLVSENVVCNVRFANGRLEIPRLEAAIYGGSLTATGGLGLEPPQRLEQAQIRLGRADVYAALESLGYSSRFAGKADLEASFSGRFTPAVRDLAGRGRMRIERLGARLDLPRINLFNVAPILKDLKQVEDLAGIAEFRLHGDDVEIDKLFLENADLRAMGSGHLTLDGRVSVGCNGFLRSRLTRDVPGFVRSSLERNEAGDLVVPFRVENSLAEPRVAMGSAIGHALLRPLKKVFN